MKTPTEKRLPGRPRLEAATLDFCGIRISKDMRKYVEEVGGGNLSKGIREIVNDYRQQNKEDNES